MWIHKASPSFFSFIMTSSARQSFWTIETINRQMKQCEGQQTIPQGTDISEGD
jgi:hypothetical protein